MIEVNLKLKMKLRNYQEKLLQNVKIDCRYGLRNICCVLPCGGGKTVIMAEMIKGAMEKGSNVLFLVHRLQALQNQLKYIMVI